MKKVISLALIMILLVSGLFVFTACGEDNNGGAKKNDNVTPISYDMGKGKITISVPKKDDGTPKYEFVTEKPEGMSKACTVYISTDTTNIGICSSSMSYNTSKDYKAKYGDQKATFDGYLQFIDDADLFNKSYLPGLEQFEINGRKALRYYNRAGGSGKYEYYGYFYMIAADDIYPGSKLELVVNYKGERPTEVKEFDSEVLDIISSLKLEAK